VMKRVTLTAVVVASLLAPSMPAFAASKKAKDCGHQAAVAGAIQKARLEGVREKKVRETVLAGEVTWPDRYNAAIPLFTAEIYKLKKADLKEVDLGAQWKEACLAG